MWLIGGVARGEGARLEPTRAIPSRYQRHHSSESQRPIAEFLPSSAAS